MGRRDSDTDAAPDVAADPGASAMLGWALVCGTVLASPMLLAAAQGQRDVVDTVQLYGLLLVASWIGCNVLGGLLDMLDTPRQHFEDDGDPPAAAPGPTSNGSAAPTRPETPTRPATSTATSSSDAAGPTSVDQLAGDVTDAADVGSPSAGGQGG